MKKAQKVRNMNREEIAQLQLERLQAVLNRVYRKVPAYSRMFDKTRLLPEQIERLEDIGKLPFTGATTLAENYPYGMFTVPLREVVRLHSTTEAAVGPLAVGYTRNDLDHWGMLAERALTWAGVTPDDVVQISFGTGSLASAYGFQHGAERLGACVIPASGTELDEQLRLMHHYRTTVLIGTPRYAYHVLQRIREKSMDPKELYLKCAVLGGEVWSDAIRQKIEEGLAIRSFDFYGPDLILGPGVGGECQERAGLHINEDSFFVEVVDPESDRRLPPGQEGELVITTLTKEAFPLIRFRTGDVTSLVAEPCRCGTRLARISRISQRLDDRIVVNDVRLFPSQIGKILGDMGYPGADYQLVLSGAPMRDELEIRIKVTEKLFADEMRRLREMQRTLTARVFDQLGVRSTVTLVEPRTAAMGAEGSGRVIDKRAH